MVPVESTAVEARLVEIGGDPREMKRRIGILLLTALLVMAAGCAVQEQPPARGNPAVPDTHETDAGGKRMPSAGASSLTLGGAGQVLVRFQDGIETREIERIQKEAGLRALQALSPPRLYLMEIIDGSSVEDMLERLKRYAEIVYAEPNHPKTLKKN
jgi:hypothetical protein